MNSKAILLGYSGHGYVIAEGAILSGINIRGYADKSELTSNPFQLEYLGDEASRDFIHWSSCENYLLGIGNNRIRLAVADRVKKNGGKCLSILHPTASVSNYSTIGQGTFIARNAVVNPLVSIGDNVIVNTSSVVDHECKVENGAHIAPGAVLAGNVTIGEAAFIGANAVIKEGVVIGVNAIVGAGSVVLNNVPANAKVVGNPARFIE